MILSPREEGYIEGYAMALQAVMYELTGENTCSKSYDPCECDDKYINSYAFDLKDGGRHHPLADYDSVKEVTELMLAETVARIKDAEEY